MLLAPIDLCIVLQCKLNKFCIMFWENKLVYCLFIVWREELWRCLDNCDHKSVIFCSTCATSVHMYRMRWHYRDANIEGRDFLTDCREWLTWLDEIKWLLTFRLTGLFRAHCASFHIHSFLLAFFPFIFNYLISILLFPCASVRKNTRAWVPLFL